IQGAVQYSGPNNNLVVTLNRTTGSAVIQNESSLGVTIDGYTILSPDGFFNSANGVWTSFADANISGWQEANPSAQRLSELNPTGSLSIPAGQTRSLGTPYHFAPSTLGSDLQNIGFEFATPSGNRIQGVVKYTGLHNNLVLRIDRTTGNAAI